MLPKIKALLVRYRSVLLYLLFGGLTTLVNWAVYYPLTNFTSVHYQVANVIAWVAAVLFAFFTNKVWVFGKKDFSPPVLAKEMLSFFSARLFSLFAEMALMWLLVDAIHVSENIAKPIAAVVVVVLNYFFSKRFVFTDKTNKRQ